MASLRAYMASSMGACVQTRQDYAKHVPLKTVGAHVRGAAQSG